MNAREIHKVISKHVLVNDAIVIDTIHSHGSWLVDARTGKGYLDCFSQFASQPLGWNHEIFLANKHRLLDAAMHKIANSDMLTKNYAEFVIAFARITTDFPHHFFISGGCLGVENALKAAFDWKWQKLQTDGKSKLINVNNMDVIHLREAFHGRSGYTLSLTNNPHSDVKVRFYPKFLWTRVTNPKIYHPIDESKVSRLEQISIDEIEIALLRNNVAAILLEPIQGEGGDNHFRREYFLKLRQLADEHDALLIFDEVQTGIGITGKTWAHEHFARPDMICFGKKTQVAGFCSTTRIDEVENNVFRVPSRINSTWGGNIIDMVRATIYFEIIEKENLVYNAAKVGKYFLNKLQELGLENARGRGLMLAFDLSDAQERDNVAKRISENMLVLPCGSRSIRFRPHLTFSKEDVDMAIDFVKKAI